MSAEPPPQAHPNVVSTRLDDRQTALLHLDTKRYYSLNETGTRIWRLLEQGVPAPEMAAALAADYQVSLDRALGSVRALLAELRAEGLVAAP